MSATPPLPEVTIKAGEEGALFSPSLVLYLGLVVEPTRCPPIKAPTVMQEDEIIPVYNMITCILSVGVCVLHCTISIRLLLFTALDGAL